MNYEQALKFKVIWEQKSRPTIKEKSIPLCNDILSNNNDKLMFGEYQQEHLRGVKTILNKMVCDELTKDKMFVCLMLTDAFDGIDDDFCKSQFQCDNRRGLISKCVFQDDYIDIQIKEIQENIDGLNLAVKQAKKELCIWAYIYNVDVEQAEVRINQWKELSCLSQEWWEANHETRSLYFTKNGNNEQECHNNENAYIQFCNREKETYETFQSTLVLLKKYRDVVRPILKAGRTMNKRKNGKKNRG